MESFTELTKNMLKKKKKNEGGGGKPTSQAAN